MFEDLPAGATVVWGDVESPRPPDDELPEDMRGWRSPSATDVLDWVLDAPAGPQTIAALAALDGAILNELDEARRVAAWQKQVAYCEARVLEAIVPVAEHPVSSRFGSQEVAAVMKATVTTADRKLSLARRLAAVLTHTGEALLNGDISLAAAQTLHEQTLGLSPEDARAVEAKVLPAAERLTPGRFRERVRRAVAAADPQGFAERHREQVEQADVVVTPVEFGMTHLWGVLDAVDGAVVDRGLDAWAARHADDMPGTTVGQRRAAGLADWARRYLDSADSPRRHGRRRDVQVVIDLPTLLGLADHPGEVVGYGPIPASVARLLAADGALRRLVVDPVTGYLLDYGTTTYDVPQELTELILARETRSMFPTSQLPSISCDLDHVDPHGSGGGTSADNLQPLDRRGHNAKTHAGWTAVREPSGVVVWTSPRGLSYRVEPHDYRLGP